jgi:hypothetical protein
MKKFIVLATLIAAAPAPAIALQFSIGSIKITSHKAGKVVKNAGDAVKSIAKGTGKWVNTELITMINGERKLVIKPYLALTHDGNRIMVGPDEAHIKVAGLSMSTHHLAQRLAEIGCIVGTEGTAAMICATEAAKAVLDKEIGDMGIPAEAVGGEIPTMPVTTENPNANFCRAEPAYSSCFSTKKRPIGSACGCFNENGDILVGSIEANTIQRADGMTEVQLVPPNPNNPGFKF